MQRVRVGLAGLAAVLLIIAVSATIFSAVHHESPVVAAGAPKVDVAAGLAIANSAAPSEAATGEPLAEMGVAPNPAPTPTQQQQQQQQ